MSDEFLPGLEPSDALPAPTVEQLSPGVRLTGRRREAIAKGRHPATGRALLRTRDPENTDTCGGCVHLIGKKYDRTYWKCDLALNDQGQGPDIVQKWPACTAFEQREGDKRVVHMG